MVRLHTSLLAVILATSSALASSNEYQRRSEVDRDVNNYAVPHRYLRFGHACARLFGHNNLQSRGLVDAEDLFVRDLDAFHDLEVREPLRFKSAGAVIRFGTKVAKHKHTKNILTAADYGQQIASAFQSRGLEDDEDLFVRDLDAFDDLEAREPLRFKSAGAVIRFGTKVAKHKHTKNILTAADYGQQIASAFQSRGLEDDEDLFGRDLDAEELFGREYDLLDERDTIDDLD